MPSKTTIKSSRQAPKAEGLLLFCDVQPAAFDEHPNVSSQNYRNVGSTIRHFRHFFNNNFRNFNANGTVNPHAGLLLRYILYTIYYSFISSIFYVVK